MIPFLVRHQRMIPPLPLDKADSAALVQSALLGGSTGLPNYASSLSHGSAIRAESTYSGKYQLPAPRHCASALTTVYVQRLTAGLLVCSVYAPCMS